MPFQITKKGIIHVILEKIDNCESTKRIIKNNTNKSKILKLKFITKKNRDHRRIAELEDYSNRTRNEK